MNGLVWSSCRRGARVAMIIGAVMLLALILAITGSPDRVQAAPPYQIQQLTSGAGWTGIPAVYGGRVAWIGENASGMVLRLYDGITGSTSDLSTAVHADFARPIMHGDLIVWTDAVPGDATIHGYNVETGEQRLIDSLKNEGTSISTDGRYVVWAESSEAGNPGDIRLYDWNSGTIKKVTLDGLDEYGASVDNGYVIWERESTSDPGHVVDILLYDTHTDTTALLTSQGQRYRPAQIDSNRVVWLEGPDGLASTMMIYQIGELAAREVVLPSTSKQVWDFAGDKIVWADGWPEMSDLWVIDVSTNQLTRLTDNDIKESEASTDGRIVTWNLGNGSGTAQIYDTHSGLAYSLSENDMAFAPPTVDRGRAVWLERVGMDWRIFTVTWPLFDDTYYAHPYFAAIQSLAERRLIDGYPNAGGGLDFRPDNAVFRAQYAKMIDGALGLECGEGMDAPVNFSDLGPDAQKDLYPHEYVWTAYVNSIVYGYSDGTFRPYANINRGHVLTMTVRAVEMLHPGLLTPVPPGFIQTWGLALLAEHRTKAMIAQFNGLLTNIPADTQDTSAAGPMPRKEVAQVMYNMMRLPAVATPWPPLD